MENTTGSFAQPTEYNEYNGFVTISFGDISHSGAEFFFNQSYNLSVWDGYYYVEGDVADIGGGVQIKMEWVDPSTLPTI